MKHLLSYSVYQSLGELSGDRDPVDFLSEAGCDGLELLTGYDEVPECYLQCSPAVHLPYATDFVRGWRGGDTSCVPDDGYARFMFYGRGREGVLDALEAAVRSAEAVEPAYGVLHAASIDLDEVMCREYSQSDSEVREVFADMVNALARRLGGEPPFRIVFENLWWPGVRYLDAEDYEFLSENVAFDNWGICVDTGHMMCVRDDSTDEADSIDRMVRTFSGYPRAMKDRIAAVHMHMSLSGEYIRGHRDVRRPQGVSAEEYLADAYDHVTSMDQHRPFTMRAAAEAVSSLEPDFVTHEMISQSTASNVARFRSQRALFGRSRPESGPRGAGSPTGPAAARFAGQGTLI